MNDRIRLAEYYNSFWASVDWEGRDAADECWEWKCGKFSQGYGCFHAVGKEWHSHRIAWIYANGDITEDYCVCHHCDNPSCCRPSHLFIGTVADNNKDRANKGRTHIHNKKQYQDMQAKMARQCRRFNLAEILHIRSSESLGITIADFYQVSPQTISDVRTGKTYVDIK